MAKEMMIVFVYDTLRCLAEADDPADAVLYFHPGWVSDSQRLALCGQLMGVTHCLKALFSTPKVLTLHSGKFIIQEYGRFILAIGSDRNIPDWMLKNRADILTSFIKVYHCDLQTIALQFPGENNPRFSEKLYQMFETYLPILQYGNVMFQSVPLLDLPKNFCLFLTAFEFHVEKRTCLLYLSKNRSIYLVSSATNIFLESMQLLEHCQKNKGVLGGTILYNNKIVATQLNPKLTSQLTMIDSFRVKSPAETLETNYDLPVGVQLLVIYVKKKYYDTLEKDSERIRTWHENGFEKIKAQKNIRFPIKEPVLGSMKRDKSLLFTAVPEEDITNISPSPVTSPLDSTNPIPKTTKENSEPKINIPDVIPFSNKPRIRPNKLALSFKNSVSRDSIDEDPKPIMKHEPIFTGQTSVCSTPMLEFKRLHGNVMSICKTSEDKLLSEALNAQPIDITEISQPIIEKVEPMSSQENRPPSPEAIVVKNTKKDFKSTNEHFISFPIEKMRPFRSLSDINSGFRRISQLAAMRFGRTGPKVANKSLSLNSDDSPVEDIDDHKTSITITDPHYPVFRNDGVPISKSLFDEYLCQHYPEKRKDIEDMSKNIESSNTDRFFKEHLEGFDSDMMSSPVRRKSHDVTFLKTKSEFEKSQMQHDQSRRKSLTLPLKSLGGDKGTTPADADSQPASGSLFEQPRKKLTGVQLTPLMEKLSHLAFSEKSSGYSSRGITPMEFKDFALSTPCIDKTVTFPDEEKRRKSITHTISETDSESDNDADVSSYGIDCIKCILYVCGLQNMSMILIMQDNAARDSQTINSLWDTSMKSLGPIEQMCMEPLPSGSESSETYSFLSLDPQWGTIKRGGPWASNDIATMGYIHKDFKDDPSLTEIIIRSEDSLVFGTTCGGSEVYYQESGSKQPGLPTPADLMGTAPLKSKRRLQRDHSITIF